MPYSKFFKSLLLGTILSFDMLFFSISIFIYFFFNFSFWFIVSFFMFLYIFIYFYRFSCPSSLFFILRNLFFYENAVVQCNQLFYFGLQRDKVLYDNCNIILVLLCTIQTLLLCLIVLRTIHSLIYSINCKTILRMLH